MEYAPLEKRPDQPETNTRTDAGRFVDGTFFPAAESEYGSVWPYMQGGLHVGYGMSHSEQEAMRWQAHFGRSSGNPLLDALNPFARRLDTGENEDASSSANTSTTISRTPAVQASSAEDGFPLNEAQSENVDTALAETGQPLPEEQKAFYEAHTGHDFSRVRIHTGATAKEAADSIGAKAFAKGSDIVFARDQYNPSTAEGKGLIGHELAHVAQNSAGVHRAPKDKQESTGLHLPAIVKDTLSKFTAYLPGYELIKIVLGRDPVTGQPVASSPEAIVKAIVGLIPGGAALYNELAQTKVVSEAFHWFSAEFKKLNITVPYVVGLLKQAYDEMGILKGKENIEILKRIFGGPLSRIKDFVYKSASKLKELALKGALHLIGGAAERVYGIINKGKATLGLILADPIGFARNLMAAVGQGFKNFVGNFVGHLKNTLKSWLFGNLAKAGITLPETIDAKGIFHLAVQILGLTYQNIRSLIVGKVGDGGEEAMNLAEKTVEIVQKVSTEGPQGLWEEAKDKLASIRDTVISGIIGWVRNTIIVQAVTRLLGMFTPVGAIIEAGRGIYNTIMFFVQKANEIASLANAIFESITNIAQRRLGPAASYIETTLGKGLTLSIGFLAKYIGLGGIPEKIKAIIAKVKKPVDTAVGKVTDWIAGKVKLIVAKIKGGWDKFKDRFRKKKGGEDKGSSEQPEIEIPFTMSGEPHIITVQANSNGQTEVLMASEKPLPLETKFREAHDTLILMRHYGQTIKDPKLKQDFDRLFSDKLDRLPGDLVDQFHSLRKQYYPEKKRIIDEDSAKETVKNLKNQANKLANAIKKWGDANNIKDFSAMEIDREVNDRMYSLRKKAWIKTKEDVQQILSYYNFRGKPILFRGSLYEGKRGEHKAYVLFDDKHFDVDMYVVDPVAYREAQEKGMPPIAGKIFPDKRFPELDALSRSVALDLAAKFPEVHKLQKVGVVIVPKDQET